MGEVTGVAVQNSVLQGTLGQVLLVKLREVKDRDEVCPDVASLFFTNLLGLFSVFLPSSFLDSSLLDGILS